MNQTGSKIIGLIIFLGIICLLMFITLMPAKSNDRKQIKGISLYGNKLLPQGSYLSFARLGDQHIASNITLPILMARLEKHPFIKSADFELSKFNLAKIHLYEKNLVAVLVINNQPYLLSDEMQLLPLFQNTKFIDLPIINNPKNANEYKVLTFIKSEEIIKAYEILRAIKFTNEEMFKNLSEINLNRGSDITLTFSGIHPIIKIGSNEIPKKILGLNSIWTDIKDVENDLSRSDYVDLRSANQIYIGKAEETEI
jgi:cell division septal protein FtsQ